jgi:hypothetical protein
VVVIVLVMGKGLLQEASAPLFFMTLGIPLSQISREELSSDEAEVRPRLSLASGETERAHEVLIRAPSHYASCQAACVHVMM